MLDVIFKGLFQTVRIFFWLVLWFFGSGMLYVYFLRWWSGDQLPAVRLFNYLSPWVIPALILALIIAAVARRYWLSTVMAVPTLLVVLSYAPLFLPRASIAMVDDQSSFKVMSYNVWRNNQDVEAMTTLIKQEQPDILLVQELKNNQVQPFMNLLNNLYPNNKHHFTFDPNTLQAVASRYHISSVVVSPEKGRSQKVLIETPRGPITVINIHTNFSGWQKRYQQNLTLLEEDVITTDGPIILGGDFNTTDQTDIYGLINEHLKNAHWEAGWGFGFSYPSSELHISQEYSLPRLVRIDHIFYSEHFFAHSAGTLAQSGGSDHLPVVAEFSRIK